jgi:hypothetical protein
MRHIRTRSVVLVAAAAAALAGAPSGSADSGSADSGPAYCGALNMVASWPGAGPGQGVGVQPGGGMENAMTRDTSQNTNGNDGMGLAVALSCR